MLVQTFRKMILLTAVFEKCFPGAQYQPLFGGRHELLILERKFFLQLHLTTPSGQATRPVRTNAVCQISLRIARRAMPTIIPSASGIQNERDPLDLRGLRSVIVPGFASS